MYVHACRKRSPGNFAAAPGEIAFWPRLVSRRDHRFGSGLSNFRRYARVARIPVHMCVEGGTHVGDDVSFYFVPGE